MAVLAKPTKWATRINKENVLTEQEHKNSCEIHKIMSSITRGQHTRTKKIGPWGEQHQDDMNMDLMTHKIQKDRLETELEKQFRETEFSEEEAQAIPPSVQKKYAGKIKIKKKEQKNDDQTTNISSQKNHQQKNQSDGSTLPDEKQAKGAQS